MQIQLNNAGKRFNRDWIFRNLRLNFSTNNKYAITGHNGSGKSTLLQCIAGAVYLSEGDISFESNDTILPSEKQFQLISICSPFLEVIEEMTANEFFQYHHSFKPFDVKYSIEKILEEIGLSKHADKQIRYYSSGMKQRIKLAQAFYSQTPVLLLDEPCSNLDASGISLYNKLIEELTENRILIIASNDSTEYSFCNHTYQLGV